MTHPSHNSLFMKTLRREKVERTPIWIMRQAGRYMPEYRRMRRNVSFMDFCRNADLVAEITVMARRMLDVDAAILFSDLLVILECFGITPEYPGSDGGKIRVDAPENLSPEALPDRGVNGTLDYVFEAIRRTRAALEDEVPLLGFAGAPFTIASYMIERGASKDFARTKAYMREDRGRWDALLEKITGNLGEFLNAQIAAGVQAVQVFDSWVGHLTPEEYRECVLPHSRRLIESVLGKAPVIHFGTRTAPFLKDFASCPSDAVGVDSGIGLDEAWDVIGTDRVIQGNLDSQVMLQGREAIERGAEDVLRRAGGRPGHVFNLGHGILPQTPVDDAKFLVDFVHGYQS